MVMVFVGMEPGERKRLEYRKDQELSFGHVEFNLLNDNLDWLLRDLERKLLELGVGNGKRSEIVMFREGRNCEYCLTRGLRRKVNLSGNAQVSHCYQY